MPSKTKKQARTMRAAAHDPGFAERMDIPQSVARDFVKADKGKKSKKKSSSSRPSAAGKKRQARNRFAKVFD